MVRIGCLALLAVVLLTCSAVVFADDDSSGNINVEVTKITNPLPYLVLGIVAAVVIIAIVLSVVLLFRQRPSSHGIPASRLPKRSRTAKPAERIGLKSEPNTGFRKEGYYEELFSRPAEVDIIDERSRHSDFISDKAGGADNAVNSDDVRDRDADGPDRYLKEDERIIINVLRMKHNACTQATLRVVTDFSKARLSRILSELEERGVIFKEQQGRKNMITLKI